MTLGDLIHRYRTENKINMQEFANACGLSKAYISILERNHNPKSGKPPIPTLETIQAVGKVIGVGFNDLLAMLDRDQEVALSPLPSNVSPLNTSHLKRIPVLGRIAAGTPIYAEENIEGYTYTDLNGGAEYFGLRVRGDSMNAARIYDGDIVIIRRQDTVENGQIAAVLIDNEDATLKRFSQQGNIVTLMPQSTNPANHPFVYDLKDTSVKILGLVVRVEFTPA